MMKKICALGLAFGLMVSVAAPLCAMGTPTVTPVTATAENIVPNRPIFSAILNGAKNLLTNYPYVVACMAIGAGIGYLIQLNIPVKSAGSGALTKSAVPAITAKTAK